MLACKRRLEDSIGMCFLWHSTTGGVEIRESSGEERIDHGLHALHVDRSGLALARTRQAHEPEPQLTHNLIECSHATTLPSA